MTEIAGSCKGITASVRAQRLLGDLSASIRKYHNVF